MNSKERRAHNRSLKRAGVPIKSKEPKEPPPPPPKPPSKWWPRAKAVFKSARFLITAFSTLIGYLVLKPSILIEPYATQDARRPFAEQFSVQNNSVYDISQVFSACIIDNVQIGTGLIANSGFNESPFYVDTLSSGGGKTTATCLSGHLDPANDGHLQSGQRERRVPTKEGDVE